MEIEALEAMNEDMYLSLLMMIEVIVLITIFLAIAGFAIYLAGIAWFCFEETRQPARRRMKPAIDEGCATTAKKFRAGGNTAESSATSPCGVR